MQFGEKTRYVIALELRQTTAKSTKAYEQYENFTKFFERMQFCIRGQKAVGNVKAGFETGLNILQFRVERSWS